jgi:hypothetical protein
MTARCFLIEPMQKYRENEEQLTRFGDVEYIFKEGESRPSVFDGERFSSEVYDRLNMSSFSFSQDFVVASGGINAVIHLIGAATALAVEREIDLLAYPIRVLMFSNEKNCYVPVEIG